MGTSKDLPPPFTPGTPPATLHVATTQTGNNTPADNPPPYEPPAYNLRPDTTGPDPDEVLDPCTLVIHGRFIYPILPAPGSANTSAGEPDSEAAYQLSRAIHEQGPAAERIEFQRLDLRIRNNNNNNDPDAVAGPSLTRRAKDVYWLEHRRPMAHAGIPFQAWLEPQSRKTLGKIRVEKSPAFRHGYRANRVVSDAERRWAEREGKKVKKGEYYFVVREKDGGGREWEWSDAGGKVVAAQVREAVDGGDEVFRLSILVPLSRRTRDSLVALWCLWMWHIRVEESVPKRTWEDRKRIMQMPRVYPGPTPLGR